MIRHPSSLHRALSHPPRSKFGHGGPASRPVSSGAPIPRRTTGPDNCNRADLSSSAGGAGPGAPARGFDIALVVGFVWLTVLAVTGSLGAGAAALAGLLTAGVLLSAALMLPRPSDRLLATLLGLLLLPAMLLVALIVKLTSRGPALVREPRVEGDDRKATVLRFRTTAVGRPASSDSPGQPLTPVGRLLLALSLDELPRLLDVARGHAPLLRVGQR